MINKSLLCLGHVINALVDKEAGKARHVPFRDSKLTFLLRDTWGGNSKTCLVATVSPSGLSLSETVSTLKFAQRAKLIKNNAILNEDTCGTVAALQAEVAKLRSELEKNDTQSTKKPTRNRHVYLGDTDMVAATKRRAERAERKLANLEKQMSEEREVKQTLKRKLQDETMVRKFKERRISYLQTKSTSKFLS
jgi:kinesin family protein 15